MSFPTLSEFPALVPEVERALAYTEGTHTVADIQAMITAGHAQLWPGERSVVVTQLRETPQKRLLHVFLAAGAMDEIQRLMPIVYEWGTAMGCTGASFTGRKGWARTFVTKEHGWEAKWTTFTKALS